MNKILKILLFLVIKELNFMCPVFKILETFKSSNSTSDSVCINYDKLNDTVNVYPNACHSGVVIR